MASITFKNVKINTKNTTEIFNTCFRIQNILLKYFIYFILLKIFSDFIKY